MGFPPILGTSIPTTDNVETFWKNICKLPRDENPSINNDGQKDQTFNTMIHDPNIFYLSSQREGSGERKVNVQGMSIFIPVLGVVATEFESPNSDVPDLKGLAKIDQASIKQLTVEFDGQQYTTNDLNNYIVTTDVFDVEFPPLPAQAVFQGHCGPQKSKAVADGRYLIIEPLSKKELTIRIKGNILVDPGVRCLERGFNEDLTYSLKGQ
jgi:hypothetical protein